MVLDITTFLSFLIVGCLLTFICRVFGTCAQAGDDGVWHNPLAPPGYSAEQQERPLCPFYSKVGACRFRDRLVLWQTFVCIVLEAFGRFRS